MKNKPEDIARAIAYLESSGEHRVLRRLPELSSGVLKPEPFLVKVVILDTETTGLSPEHDRVIEVGAIARYVDTRTGAFVGDAEIRSWLEDPGFPLEPHTVALTGLTDADLKGQRFDDQEIGRFLRGAGLVIAHSAAHDRPFFEARFPHLNQFAWGCSLSQINWAQSGAGSSKLEFLAFKLGCFYEAHRALPDCQALAYVLENFALPSGQTVLQELIERSGKSSAKIHATGAPFEMKDVLKGAGYFWDAAGKVWFRTVDEDAIAAEFEWLHQEVYLGRPARVRVDFISAMARFSANPPMGSVTSEVRSIGPQGERPPMAGSRAGRFGSAAGRY